MALYLYSIEDAIDRKFILAKTISGQAKAGTLIHVMDCIQKSDGSFTVCYRVTETGQDFTIDFDTLKQFCKWARADNLLARHYESLSTKDVMHYINVSGRTFTTFYLPILLVLLVVIWVVLMLLVGGVKAVIIAAVLSVLAFAGIFYYYKRCKRSIVMFIYSKVGQNSWGVIIK